MSTKTTFKRIALVAVAALGLGVLSVAPSQAIVNSLTVTTGGTATAAAGATDTTTAATISVTALLDSALDTVTVNFIAKTLPVAGSSDSVATARLNFAETTTAVGTRVFQGINGTATHVTNNQWSIADSTTAGSSTSTGYALARSASGYVGGNFFLQVDSLTAPTPGAYTYTLIVKTYSHDGSTYTVATTTKDVTITVAGLSSTSTTVAPASSTAYINAGTSYATASDSVVAAVATASATNVAVIGVRTYNAAGSAAPESITATLTGPGLICDGSACGKSLTIAGTGTSNIGVRPDGTAGVATITVKTTSATFANKSVTFYAKAAKTLTAAVNKPVISIGSNSSVVYVAAVDANGTNWAGTAYIYASSAADALIAGSETPVACAYVAAIAANACPVSGTTTGTAKFKVIDASTVALATATSNEVSVRVSAEAPASVKLAFDKSSYAPGERAVIWATVVDAAGNALPQTTITNLWSTGGISSNVALTAVSTTNTLTSVSATVAGNTDLASDSLNPTYAGAVAYVVTVPQTTGEITISATGGTGLALAGRVKVSATASVVNSSVDAATDAANEATDAANAATDAALAAADAADAATAAAQDASDAVAALSATVAKLVASLKAQITSLTNLVIKIQKKVRA